MFLPFVFFNKIEPFLFTPFIENSFRFLRKNNDSYFIHIHLEIKKDAICFSIKNSISNNFKPSLIDEIDSYKIELEIERLSA